MSLPTKDTVVLTPQTEKYAQLVAELRTEILKGMKKHKVTGMSVALVDNGEVVWSQGFGYADKGAKRPVDGDTLFKAGSISKVFTATAIMQLVEQGKVDLDAPIQTYIPEFKPRYHNKVDTPITLRQIMQHRSGIVSNEMAGMWTTGTAQRFDTVIDYLNHAYQSFAPDTMTAYSNIATDLQGIVIERVSGERYEDYIERHILQPLGMSHSSFDDARVDHSLLSHAYRKNKEEVEPALRDLPAGNLYTSALELSRFASMVLKQGNGILKPETLARMLQAQQQTQQLSDYGMVFGLNWVIQRPELDYLGPVAWHNGGTIHFMSSMVILPKQGLAAIVLSNSTGSIEFVGSITDDILQRAAQIKNGISPPPSPRPGKDISCPAAVLNTPTGYYATQMGGMKISANSKHLLGSIPGVKLKFICQADGWLNLKLKLLGLIPIKQMPLRVQFRKLDGKTVVLAEQKGYQMLAGVKVEPYAISPAWQGYLGDYQIKLPEGDYPWFKKITLIEKDGYLFILVKVQQQVSAGRLLLVPIDNNMAVIEGVGQGMNETITLTQRNGQTIAHYSGYEFVKQ